MMIKEQIKNLIKKAVKTEDFSVEIPEEKAHGDYASNIALILAKKQGKNPIEIANAIISKLDIQNSNFLDHAEVANGFINFFLKPEFLIQQIKNIVKEDKNFGKQNIGKKKTVIIDYSSPNIAKPMHVGHLRSTFIGQAIYNIYKFLGHKVIGDNHLGDWGTQFGIMIAGCKKFRPKISDLQNITISEMLDIYTRFNGEIEKNPDLREVAKEEFKKLEDGDKENRKIWKILRGKSLKEFEKIYQILGVKFDLILGESFYEKYLKEEIANALKEKAAIKNPDNSVIIPLDKFNPVPFLIQKADGATVYGTRDLATIRYRIKKFNPAKIIYVIGNEQSFYLEQLFHSAELLNYISYNQLYHMKFGLVLDENRQKLSTRAGRVIDAKELINKAIDLADKIIEEKNPKLSEKERKKAARIIGVGALKYNDLSQNRQSDIVFDWDKMLSFEGNSGPYLQYSYVRLRSILRKAGKIKKFQPQILKEKEEIRILKELIKFPEIVQEAGEKFQVNFLANYLYNLAGLINAFYEKFPVLKAEKGIKEARLALIKSATIVLRNGLNLLGIEVLEKM
jgi:arginyl-tRNA synthetase